jgi:isopenicillin N synthase-like dioxygenase
MPDIAAFKQDGDVMSTAHLPLIDISPYLSESSTEEERLKTSRALDSACRTFGQ